MIFFPLTKLTEYTGCLVDLNDEPSVVVFHQRLREKLKSNPVIDTYSLSEKEIVFWSACFGDPQKRLFYTWLSSNKSLLHTLTGGNDLTFSDPFKHLEHRYGENYRSFLSPFLYSRFIGLTNDQNVGSLLFAASYLRAMNGDEKIIVEDQLCTTVVNLIKKINQTSTVILDEQLLADQAKQLCSDSMLSIINALSKSGYATKVEYVEQVLEMIQMKACTRRLAFWILTQLQKLNLNDEHQKKIRSLTNQLETGKIQVKNHYTNEKSKFKSGNRILIVASLIFLFGLSIYFITYNPFRSQEKPIISYKTSFEQFTPKERKEMDSVLQTIDRHRQNMDATTDAPIYGGSATLVNPSNVFKNKQMERLYLDFLKDVKLTKKGVTFTGKAYPKKKLKETRYEGVSDLKNNKKEQTASFTNNSEYDILFFVIDNNPGGKIYSKLIQPKESINFELFLYDELLFIPGRNFGPFVQPKNISGNDLPSNAFKHHFLSTDANYVRGVEQIYRMNSLQSKRIELVATGSSHEKFYIEDQDAAIIEL